MLGNKNENTWKFLSDMFKTQEKIDQKKETMLAEISYNDQTEEQVLSAGIASIHAKLDIYPVFSEVFYPDNPDPSCYTNRTKKNLCLAAEIAGASLLIFEKNGLIVFFLKK